MRNLGMASISRRSFATAILSTAVLGASGCAQDANTQIRIVNRRATEVSIRVEVAYVSADPGEELVDETLTLPAGEEHVYQNLFEESVEKRLTITPGDGQQAQHEWEAGTYPGGGYISVRIREDEIDVGHAAG